MPTITCQFDYDQQVWYIDHNKQIKSSWITCILLNWDKRPVYKIEDSQHEFAEDKLFESEECAKKYLETEAA